MKVARFVLKVVALSLSVAAAVCCIIAFSDKIAAGFGAAVNKVRSKRQYAEGCCAEGEDDYADWDE